MNRRKAVAVAVLICVNYLATGAGYFWLSHQASSSQAAQQRAGQLVGEKLCSTFGRLAALQPPAGSAAANPARGYEQQLHQALDELGTDLGCKGLTPWPK